MWAQIKSWGNDFKKGFISAVTLQPVRELSVFCWSWVKYQVWSIHLKWKRRYCTRFHSHIKTRSFMGWCLGEGQHPEKCTKCGAIKYRNKDGSWYLF